MIVCAFDFYGNVPRIRQDKLFNFQRNFFDRKSLEQIGSQLFRQGFELFARALGREAFDVLDHVIIIDGSRQIIGPGGMGKGVDAHFQRDEEPLGLASFRIRHAEVGEYFEVNDADEIGHNRGGCGWGR